MLRLAAVAPEFQLLRQIARRSSREYLRNPDTDHSAELAARCVERWETVYRRHPRDHETVTALARALDWINDFEGAEQNYRLVVGTVDGRERRYGLRSQYAEHLRLWADALWHQRKPARALYYFEQSRAWWQSSWQAKHYGVGPADRRKIMEWLDSRIELLKGAGITAEEDQFIMKAPEVE
jgi:hypothetical protein